jgi:Flp pilus assembly protein TadB
MSEGVILVLVILMFFGLMYLFAYGTTGYKERQLDRKRHKELQQAKLKEAQLQKDHQERLHEIDMRFEASNRRSQEIRRELEMLEGNKRLREK